MFRFFIWLAGLAILASFGSAQGSAIVWRSYKAGQNSAVQTADERVIQTQGAFDTYWRELMGDVHAPRDIDFSKELLIAVRLGSRPTGGYRALIRSIERTRPNEIRVRYEERKPAAGSITTLALTSPWEIVRVERKTAVGAFIFEKKEVVDNAVGGGEQSLFNWRTYQCDLTGGGPTAFTRAIRSSLEWDSYWRVFTRSGKAPADIDWNNEMVIAVHLGSRPSDGYDVLIEAVEPVRGGFVVHYLEKAPSEGQRVRSNPTSPYVIIRLPRLEGEIQFRKRVWRSDG